MEWISEKQVIKNRQSSGRLILERLNIASFFNIFLTKKLNIRKPINIFIGAGDIDIKNGMRIMHQ